MLGCFEWREKGKCKVNNTDTLLRITNIKNTYLHINITYTKINQRIITCIIGM